MERSRGYRGIIKNHAHWTPDTDLSRHPPFGPHARDAKTLQILAPRANAWPENAPISPDSSSQTHVFDKRTRPAVLFWVANTRVEHASTLRGLHLGLSGWRSLSAKTRVNLA